MLAYASISICITFFNKGLFSYYHFKHPGFMTGTQIVFSLSFLAVGRLTGLLGFPIERKHAAGCAVLAVLWVINVLAGVAALQYLTVPMWSTLRRCAPPGRSRTLRLASRLGLWCRHHLSRRA